VTRVFLDANVLFSAAEPGSALARLVGEAGRRVELVYSPDVATEARRNIAAKRPQARDGLETVLGRCQRADSALFPLPIELNDNDRAVLCAAIRAGCQYLVTGDKQHFGPFFGETIESVKIVSTNQFAQLLRDFPPRGHAP
jgi:predicted nucleic acid-binding protein